MRAKARKRKTVGVQRSAKRGPKTVRAQKKPTRRDKDDSIDALMTAGTKAIGLAIDPAWRGAVKFHLQLVLSHAAKVDEFALPDDAEPAPIFHA